MLVMLYLIGMIFEIFMPCYYGSMLQVKSEQLLVGLYRSNWMPQSRKFKSSMLIIGQRAMQPIIPLVGGGLLALALPTFVAVKRVIVFP